MTQEEKQLLLQDLCGRLPYGVKAKITEEGVLSYDSGIGVIVGKEHVDNEIFILQCKNDSWCLTAISEFVPYLRPMSSMTEKELNECVCQSGIKDIECPNWQDITKEKQFEARLNHAITVFLTDSNNVDWLNSHYFDYRGLIERGLALEAPENMYKHFGDMDVIVNSIEHKDKL